MENLNHLKTLLKIPQKVVILSHRNPDGDALGSSLGLQLILNRMGHQATVILPSDFPAIFYWMPGADQIVIADHDVKTANQIVSSSEMIFCLDFNTLDRVDNLALAVSESSKPKVLIDHHVEPYPFADYMLVNTMASSTAELVYEFLHLIGETHRIDKDVSKCLLTGIITDTGSFKYNVNPEVFVVVSNLLKTGVDYQDLQYKIFNNLSLKQLDLLGFCLSQRMEIIPEYKAAIIYLNKGDYQRFRISRGDTEGIVNYPLTVGNIMVSIFITQQPTIIKLSFRSKSPIIVNQLARDHFNGGGHIHAAGGYVHLSLRKTIDKVKALLPFLLEPIDDPSKINKIV